MIKPKEITFFTGNNGIPSILTHGAEIRQMVKDLTPSEIMLFTIVVDIALQKHKPVDTLKNKALAEKLGMSTRKVSKLKWGLKSKGYMVINFTNDSQTKVYVGKDQVSLLEKQSFLSEGSMVRE